MQTSIVTGSESSLRAGSSAWCVNISLKIAKSNCHSNVSLALIKRQEEQASCFKFTGKVLAVFLRGEALMCLNGACKKETLCTLGHPQSFSYICGEE